MITRAAAGRLPSVVRPDQYVAHELPLDAQEDLADFLAGVLLVAGAVAACAAAVMT